MTSRYFVLTLAALLILANVPARAQDRLKIATVDVQELFKTRS